MPHHHDHSHGPGCNHEADDDHLKPGEGVANFLFSHIDLDHVVGYNDTEEHPVRAAIKPWDLRSDESAYAESDADEQLIVRIPFTGAVKLRSLFLKTGPGEMTPTEVRLFANSDELDFDSAPSATASQVLFIPETREVAEYTVRPSKFSSLRSLTLFFPSNAGGENTRIYFIGLKGEFAAFTRDPVVAVYEAQANPADHQRISGFEAIGRTL